MQAQPKKKTNWLLIITLILAVFMLFYISSQPDKSKEITFSQFDSLAKEEGKIKKIEVVGNDIYIMLNENSTVSDEKYFPNEYDYKLEYPYSKTLDYLEKLNETNGIYQKVSINYTTPTESFFDLILPYIIFGAFSILLIVIIMRLMGRSNSNAMSFGKSRARLIGDTKVTFADVAGCDEEKQELKEIVDFLKNPQKFISLGARIPKGFLLVGPPGTGKTLLARAVAGESNVPFYSITGSDFVEMFVGVGASRVRSLFEQAKRSTPCIVFIDEIDAVGRQRGTGMGGGNDEREQTLNQLLVEMDGFASNSGIIVIAATNRSDVLDPALLRPGRFDRQIYVYPPDVKGREEIIKVHAKNKPLASDIDYKTIARLTTGFTGADISLLLNEAAILAAREGCLTISMTHLTEAINKVIIGPQKKSKVVTERDKKITAYHEAGHAIIGKVLLQNDEVQEVSIIPRGGAGGYTLHRPNNDNSYKTISDLTNEIVMTMGGRAAEILKLKDFTTGASADIKHATSLARKMVVEWGMSDLGPIDFGSSDEYFLGRDYQMKAKYSEVVANDIDKEISKIVNSALNKAVEILKEKDDILENMTKLLLAEETIFQEEIDLLMKGKTCAQIVKKLKLKESKRKAQLKKQAEEAVKNKEDLIKEKQKQEALEAAKFLESAGLLKIEQKQVKTQEITSEEIKKDDVTKNDKEEK